MSTNEPEDGERGVMINTASIAAFEGQIGQVAYAAAKSGIVGMVFTMARDLGSLGIRAMAIAPSLFATGLTEGIPDEFAATLTKDAAFPKRLGPARGVRQARRGDRREPDAQRPLHPPRRRHPLRPQVGRRIDEAPVSPVRSIDLHIDVTEAAGLGEPAHIALTVTAPDDARRPTPSCASPSRAPATAAATTPRTCPVPAPAGSQATWHAERGLDLRLRRPPRRGRQLAP